MTTTSSLTSSVPSFSGKSDWSGALNKAGNSNQNIKKDMISAFSITDFSQGTGKELVEKYAPKGTDPNEVNPDSFQLIMKEAYDRSSRTLTLLGQLLESAHQQAMRVINNIGRS